MPRYRYEFATADVATQARLANGLGDLDDVFEPIMRDIPINFQPAGTGELGRASQFIVEGDLRITRVVDLTTGAIVWLTP